MPASTLDITIKAVEDLNTEEQHQSVDVDRAAFAGAEGDIEWSKSQWVVIGAVGGVIVSQIFVLVREVAVGEQKVRAGGVGGVATHPDQRRHGYAGQLLRATEQFMRDLDLPFGLLVCSEGKMPYYASFGWQKIDNRTIFQNQGKNREMDGVMMILALKDQPWPDGLLNLNGKPW
jgi:aminoglycoside 2'-N-acetyltransferase I